MSEQEWLDMMILERVQHHFEHLPVDCTEKEREKERQTEKQAEAILDRLTKQEEDIVEQ